VARTSGVRATGEKTARAPDWRRTGGRGEVGQYWGFGEAKGVGV